MDFMDLLESKPPSRLISDIISQKGGGIRVEDLIEAFGSQGFGLMFIIIALPLTVPLPPGVGFIPSVLLLVWAFQRAMGGTRIWLPKFIGRKVISREIIEKIENKAIPLCRKLEGYIMTGKQTTALKEAEIRLASLAVVLLSLFIMLPSFLNSLPAIVVILIGLTLLNGNRKLLWINMSVSILAMGLLGSTIYVGSEALLREIRDYLQATAIF